MCFDTVSFLGNVNTWTNRIFYDNFSENEWKKSFSIDTWNNSLFCCSNPEVSPTYNLKENVISDELLTLRVLPQENERIKAYSSSISSYRDDILYGSFRISAKMSPIEGTSFGFFFFYSVSEEIDIEVLAHEQRQGRIRGSIQPIIRDSSNRASNLSQKVIELVKPLSEEFVEYRFDWFESRVDFFADGKYYYSLTVNTPDHNGKIILNHRTNGNPKWSKGPPNDISDVHIKYIDIYFNSSTSIECNDINHVENIFTGQNQDTFKKYIGSIVVSCLIVFIISVVVSINVYRKIHPKKSIIKEQNTNSILSRKP